MFRGMVRDDGSDERLIQQRELCLTAIAMQKEKSGSYFATRLRKYTPVDPLTARIATMLSTSSSSSGSSVGRSDVPA